MRYFRSQGAHKRYAPYQSGWRRFLSNRKKRQQLGAAASEMKNTWTNPYRRRVKTGDWGNKRPLIALAGGFIVALIWLGMMTSLPYFQITKISYSGLKIIKQGEIDKDIRENLVTPDNFWPRDNYFLLSADKIAKYLREHYSLNTIKVAKSFPNELRIDLEEKISTVIYDNGKDYYLLDQGGAAIKYLSAVSGEEIFSQSIQITSSTFNPTSSSLASNGFLSTSSNVMVHIPNYKKINNEFGPFPIIYAITNSASSTAFTTPLLSSDLISGVINFYTQISAQGIAQVKYLVLDNPMAGIIAKTNKRWDVYFEPTENISSQLKNLKIILKEANPSSYIDLRYGERVYWK